MNIITNTQPRRISMAYFAGLFLLALAIPCIAFVKSVKLSAALPAKEIAELKEKERIVKAFADMSDALRTYQTAQMSKSPDATRLATEAKSMIMKLYSELSGKDTSRVYQDINRSLNMANQYYEFILQSNLKAGETNPLIPQLQADKLALQNENQLLKIQLANCGKGAAAPCPPARVEYVTTAGKCPPCPTVNEAAPCNCDRECQSKVNEYKQKINPTLVMLNSNVNNIRREMGNIECFLNLGGKNKKEKANIDQNLRDIETTVARISGQ